MPEERDGRERTFTIRGRTTNGTSLVPVACSKPKKVRLPKKSLFCSPIRIFSNTEESCGESSWMSRIRLAPLMTFCDSLGLSSFSLRKSQSKWLRYIAIGYNVFVFFALAIYCLALIFVLYADSADSNAPLRFHRQFTLLFTLFGLFLNVILHRLKACEVKQLTECTAADRRVVAEKDLRLKRTCVFALVFVSVLPVVVVVVRVTLVVAFSSDSDYSPLLPCGVFCFMFDEYALYVCSVIVLAASSLFLIFAVSMCFDVRDLRERIHKCTGGFYVDHLIYRYQSLELCVRCLERLFSLCLLVSLVVSGFAVIFFVRQMSTTDHFLRSVHYLTAFLCVFFLLLTAMVFLVGSAVINSKLARFQDASYKIADLQQIQFSTSHTVKLLIFMLRLSSGRDFLTAGGLFVANRQNILLMFLLVAIVAIAIFVVDEECVQIF